MIQTVQISNHAAVTLETPRKKESSFLDGYIVNSIIAFTISLLLFFRAQTAFALDTFACDMTNSMSLTSTPVSSTWEGKYCTCNKQEQLQYSLLGVRSLLNLVLNLAQKLFHSLKFMRLKQYRIYPSIQTYDYVEKMKSTKDFLVYLFLFTFLLYSWSLCVFLNVWYSFTLNFEFLSSC